MTLSLQKIFVLLLFLTSSLAQADSLKIYVIKPKLRIDWSSPASLSVTSGLNSATNDYAPIGHFAIELTCSRANRYGIRHVLTGMERVDKKASRNIVMKEGLGLASLTHSFEGALQSAKESAHDLQKAREQNRLKVIRIETSADRCDSMMQFLENWIDSGSDSVYGGNKNTAQGEGAGCADFAMHFFKLATATAVPAMWVARVQVPLSLMKTSDQKISFTRLLTRFQWARSDEAALDFKMPDTNLVTDWLENHSKRCGSAYLWSRHAISTSGLNCQESLTQIRNAVKDLKAAPSANFIHHYPLRTSVSQQWNQVSIQY